MMCLPAGIGLVRPVSAAGAAPTFEGSTPYGLNDSGSLSRSWPAHVAGDYGVVFVVSANQPPGAASGWTKLAELGVGAGATPGSISLSVYGRFAAGTTDPAFSVAIPGVWLAGTMLVFRGVNASAPIDVTETNNGVTSSLLLPSATTTGASRLIVTASADSADAGGDRYSSWANANLSGYAEVFEGGGSTYTGGGLGIAAGEKVAAGATGASTATFGLVTSNYVGITLALNPA